MSPSDEVAGLERRVERLERIVEKLIRGEVEPTSASRAASAEASYDRPAAARPVGTEKLRSRATFASAEASGGPDVAAKLAGHGERWLARVGVAFVVLSFGFLFKYAFDQGWITPAARLLFGMIAGGAMIGVGLRLEGSRERYSQYLLGGGIGVYYLVGFAAFQLYELVSFAPAFAYMASVTVLGFVLAERQRYASLAVVAATGGLATPFLLDTGTPWIAGLVAYTVVVLLGAGGVQFLRGWRVLLFVLGLGGLGVMALAAGGAAGAQQWVVMGGVLVAWAIFAVLPLVRAHLASRDPERWAVPAIPWVTDRVGSTEGRLDVLLLRLACYGGALLAALELALLFELGSEASGGLLAVGSAFYAILAWRLRGTRWALDVAAEVAAVLASIAVWLMTGDPWSILPLAALGGALHQASRRWSLTGVGQIAHWLFVVVALLMMQAMGERMTVEGGSPFALLGLSHLAAILVTFGVSFAVPSDGGRGAYRLAAHVALLVWLYAELESLAHGQGLVSLAWGVYGMVILLVSLRLASEALQLAGLSTLGIVAAKMLLVDMAQLDMIWRILLFMGFGAAFLWLSYMINRPSEDRPPPP